MLTEFEARSVFDELVSILRETNFDWLVDEVSAVIQMGKTETKLVRVTQEVALLAPGGRPRTRPPRAKTEAFTESLPYSEHEKLALLVRAVRRATVEVAEIMEHTIALFSQPVANHQMLARTLDFQSEVEPPNRDYSAHSRAHLKDQAIALAELLREIESELDATAA